MKRKILFSILMTIITVVLAFTLFVACNSDNGRIENDYGIVVVGGGFKEGATVVSEVVELSSEEGKAALEAIKDEEYDKDGKVYVFDISVESDGVKVQPNGKVKVTVPVSENLTGYVVLHIKGNGSVERLSVIYKNGKATFETDSFSKFAFVKKASSGSSGNGGGNDDGGNTGGDNTTKYTVYTLARRIVNSGFSDGGSVLDKDGEHITYTTLSLAEGTEYTLQSLPGTDYYFVGWYEASEREEATEETLLSTEPTYTFTVSKNINICALYAYKTDVVKFEVNAEYYGFSYRNGEPTLTVVSKDAEEVPRHEEAYILAELGNGNWENYGAYGSSKFSSYVVMDLGGLDYSKVGTYTISYSYKYNTNIKATLTVQVVDSAHTLNVSTNNDSQGFFYNRSGNKSISQVLPEGRLVTLTACPTNGYAFTGWYDAEDKLVSNKLVYCFEMPNNDVTLHGKYEKSSLKLYIWTGYKSGCELVDDFGNAYVWGQNTTLYFKDGDEVSFTVRDGNSYEFLGWYADEGSEPELITADKKITLTITENKSIEAQFREKLKYIEIDADTLSDEGFVDGKIGFAIGDEAIDYQNFTVNAKGIAGSDMTLTASDYTIDDSSLDLNTVGTYTITYTYKLDTSIKTQIQIEVVNPESEQFTFEKGYSHLDHEYNGKATFISLKDVKFNGVALYNFKSSSKIWEKLSYKWIDKATGQEVDTTDVDVTINGTVVKNFGPTNYKRTIGNELCGPIKAGSYRFELMYDGKTVITQDSTITTQVYKKITSGDELTTNEGSTWINFELYYYTIIGYADGKYYAMEMPSIGSENVEVEAREISVDANGNAVVGEGNDFACVYVRYWANDSLKRMEFLTGYYGSYVDYSSDSTVDGTMFGMPYIYRTGHMHITDGKVCREYGNKDDFGMSITFADDGAVTICSNGDSENGRLRLVKDGDKYVFTSVAADTDERESFDIYMYRTIINNDVQETEK